MRLGKRLALHSEERYRAHTACLNVPARHEAGDIALIPVSGAAGHMFAPLRLSARLGEGIPTFGYPHRDLLTTAGNVTALGGVNEEARFYQVSAPVQSALTSPTAISGSMRRMGPRQECPRRSRRCVPRG